MTAASRPSVARGTATSGIFDLGFGYTPSTIPGLEMGGRLGWSLGGPASLAINGTARYMFPVLATPRIYVGPELGLGLFAALGAKQQAYLDLHAAAVGAWNILPNFGAEVAFSADGAVGSLFLIGGAARGVVRF